MLLDRNFDVSIDPVSPVAMGIQDTFNLQQFLFEEAALLDERRFDEWLALWTADGRYWVPRHHEQKSPFDEVSIFWEDRMLRETRVRRLLNDRNWSQQPITRTSRLIGNVRIEGLDRSGQLIVSSRVHVSEYRLGLRHLSGRVVHKLTETESGWRIALKRIDLVDSDSVFTNIEVFV